MKGSNPNSKLVPEPLHECLAGDGDGLGSRDEALRPALIPFVEILRAAALAPLHHLQLQRRRPHHQLLHRVQQLHACAQ